MRKVLTTQSTVTCGTDSRRRTGAVQAASTAKLKVDGNPVLLGPAWPARTVTSVRNTADAGQHAVHER